MATQPTSMETLANQEYKWGFVTEIDADTVPPGLGEDTIRLISARKNEPQFMLDWRLKAYRAWLKMTEPRWQNVEYQAIDYQDIIYYSAPKAAGEGPKSLDEIDPELRTMFGEALGDAEIDTAAAAGDEGYFVAEEVFSEDGHSVCSGSTVW